MTSTIQKAVKRTELMTKHRDKEKKDKVSQAKKESVLDIIEKVTLAVVDDPSLWINLELGGLKKIIIRCHPSLQSFRRVLILWYLQLLL